MDVRALLKRLDHVALEILEIAAKLAVDRRSPEVTIAHYLRSALDVRSSDVAALFEARGLTARACEALDAAARSESAAAGRPIFSLALIQLVADADARAQAATDQPAARPRLRTGELLARLVSDPKAYGCAELVERVGGAGWSIDVAGLRFLRGEGASTSARPQPVRSAPRVTLRHRVAAGERLVEIARRYACDPEDVARQNQIPLEGALQPGWLLELDVLVANVPPASP